MNIENFKRVRDYWITLNPDHVNMGYWYITQTDSGDIKDTDAYSIDEQLDFTSKHHCGTTACLAGHIQHKFAEGCPRLLAASNFAREFLGLDAFKSAALFSDSTYYIGVKCRMCDVTHEHVLRELNRIINTGEFYSEEHDNEH